MPPPCSANRFKNPSLILSSSVMVRFGVVRFGVLFLLLTGLIKSLTTKSLRWVCAESGGVPKFLLMSVCMYFR